MLVIKLWKIKSRIALINTKRIIFSFAAFKIGFVFILFLLVTNLFFNNAGVCVLVTSSI